MSNLSNKIGSQYKFEDDKLIIKSTYDATVAINDAAYAREVTQNSFGSDNKYVGNVDVAMLNNWLKEAGVKWTDTQGVNDVVKKKLMSNEFSKLRVWEGSY